MSCCDLCNIRRVLDISVAKAAAIMMVVFDSNHFALYSIPLFTNEYYLAALVDLYSQEVSQSTSSVEYEQGFNSWPTMYMDLDNLE